MEQQVTDQTALVRELGFPLYQGKGWIKFLGILSIVQGVIAALTIIGIIFAWLPIWIGILLYQSATMMERAYAMGDRRTFVEAMGKLKTYFLIQGITALLGIILAIFAFSLGMLGAIFEAIS
jgi:hypothetical protein